MKSRTRRIAKQRNWKKLRLKKCCNCGTNTFESASVRIIHEGENCPLSDQEKLKSCVDAYEAWKQGKPYYPQCKHCHSMEILCHVCAETMGRSKKTTEILEKTKHLGMPITRMLEPDEQKQRG